MAGASLKRILIAIGLAVPLLALLLLWLERRPIARDAIDRELARRHVRARYAVTAIGPRTQRLEKLVIGDPAHPDLLADSATVVLAWGLTGPYVRSFAASRVRLRGRVTPQGTLSLGEIDRLLPAPSGGPLALPDLNLALSDATMRLDTPAGLVALALRGSGNLQDGFSGRLGAVASKLEASGCTLTAPTLFVAVRIADREPMLDGPLRAGRLACPRSELDVQALWLSLKVRFGPELDRWSGNSGITLGAVRQAGNRLAAVRGTVSFGGNRRDTEGDATLLAGPLLAAGTRAARARISGRYAIDGGSAYGFTGRVAADDIAIDRSHLDMIAGAGRSLGATPLGPIAEAWGAAARRAAARVNVTADLSVSAKRAGGAIQLDALDARGLGGGRVGGEAQGLRYGWGDEALAAPPLRASATIGGGGLPDIRIALRRPGSGAPLTGEAVLSPYAAGTTRISATPVQLLKTGGVTRLATTISLDGPLAGGLVTGLGLPIELRMDGSGALVLNERCLPVRFASLAISGARFGAATLPLCPTRSALFARTAEGRIGGGGRFVSPRLSGSIGGSPLSVAARSVAVDTIQAAVTIDALSLGLGASDARTMLAVRSLTARGTSAGLGGRFAGAAGQIGRVPLRLSDADGAWSLAGARLTLDGRLHVADTATPPRFNPLVSRDVHLLLDGGRIRASGWLEEPRSERRITQVSLSHDLSTGAGRAILDVPGLVFDDRLQPEALTRSTLGVVASVKGSVRGAGHIGWTEDGVTSDGSFSTEGLALAAAFGPVSGISGTIRFSDLLALATPPHQEAALGEVNPGIAVYGGRIRYQLLPGQLVKVEGGEWPLAGGTLALKPTLLDFSKPTTRRFSFRVAGLDAGKFIEQFKLDNINATGTFDGVLPMIFDEHGGRISGGHLVARSPGGRLSYVGEVSNAQLGTYGTLAFDALKSIRYQALALDLDGALDGEVISRISFSGINDKPTGVAPVKGFAKSFTNLPFKFNIVVRAPFRGLLNSAAAFADPGALLKQQAVQPQESPAVGEKP